MQKKLSVLTASLLQLTQSQSRKSYFLKYKDKELTCICAIYITYLNKKKTSSFYYKYGDSVLSLSIKITSIEKQ